MKRFILNFSKCIIIYILFAIVILFMLYTSPVVSASSSDNSVLEDLTRDPNFNETDYLNISDNYSLQVIQIAETNNKELIIYVYQPSDSTLDLLGTKISISYGYSTNGKNLNPALYSLELLSTYGMFDKYLVKNFNVPSDSHRYYNIISISREYNSSIDVENNDIMDYSDIAYSVGQQWHAYYINDSVSYEMCTFDTIELDTTLVSSFEFSDGLNLKDFTCSFNWGDCWFIAFNCEDYIIDHIFDADLTYNEKSVSESWTAFVGTTFEYGKSTSKKITLTDSDVMSYTGSGFFAGTFEWNRILSSTEFLNSVANNDVPIDNGVKEVLLKSQWVFTFAETKRSMTTYSSSYIKEYFNISEVGILRLHFQDISGKYYDLGVVNSLVDPNEDFSAGYGNKILSEMSKFFDKTFSIIALILLGLVLIFCSSILMPVVMVLKFVIKALSYFISIPIRLIKWVFKR